MNEARIAQYLDLIQKLLSCPSGEEPEQLLLIVRDSRGNPQQVYPFLRQNLDKLDLRLVEVLTAWSTNTFAQVETSQAIGIAADIGNLATLIKDFPLEAIYKVNL